MNGPAEALSALLAALDRLEIPYMVGGSVASSIHGMARPTMDVDVIAGVTSESVGEFLALLRSDFYSDEGTAREAIARGRAFNLIHFKSSYKFDIFPLRRDAYKQVEFSRRQFRESALFGEPIEFCVASPEDTILSKMQWYRLGGGISEKQWEDIRGVLRVQQGRLDWEYLQKWARELGMEDLLHRLCNPGENS